MAQACQGDEAEVDLRSTSAHIGGVSPVVGFGVLLDQAVSPRNVLNRERPRPKSCAVKSMYLTQRQVARESTSSPCGLGAAHKNDGLPRCGCRKSSGLEGRVLSFGKLWLYIAENARKGKRTILPAGLGAEWA